MTLTLEEDLEALEESEEQASQQMELFVSATTDKTTNTIYLYDVAPKYLYNSRELEVTESAFDVRHMRVHKVEYEVEVQAARFKKKNGEEVLRFPSEREEFIEDALRKLATSGSGVFINGDAGVKFTIYQLQEELKSLGHTFSWTQLREGLYVMRRSGLKITNKATGETWEENFLARLAEGGVRTDENGRSYEPWYASFHN
jgi:hypothetical protein